MTADRDSYFADDKDVVLPEDKEPRKPLLLQAKILAPILLMVLLTGGSIVFIFAMNPA